ncbi:MAG: hypothetical protein HFI72_07530, partial [Peptococcaceae bacterium]|nr:hypothetical protein [Peptococcaceae bacterium]
QLENGKTYTLSAASVSNTVIEVASGRTATVVVPKNVAVTIDDYNNGCSPISLLGSGKLNLVVDGTLTVTGGKAEDGQYDAVQYTAVGGAGGYPGIGVPVGTSLIISGSGTVTAAGGDAGRGGNANNGSHNASGGGGAGAGIGGIGGKGGDAGAPYRDKVSGTGGSMGSVMIYETVVVNAYGGGGAGNTADGIGAAGGYPAAGVGGGGAGGGGAGNSAGAGGFCGAGGGSSGVDGGPATPFIKPNYHTGGGGYFAGSTISNYADKLYKYYHGGAIGGGGAWDTNTDDTNTWEKASWKGGHGGTAGAGGTVVKGELATLQAANGSYQTNIPRNYGKTPTPIYAQSGYDLELLRTAGVTKVDAGLTAKGVRSKGDLENELGATGKSSTIQATALAGVGSGAGYLESRNGSFTIQKVPEYCHAVHERY